ncbi:MAG: DUF1684 domain-containing protein [Candidatus Kapabacteria bacterium]|nr:DUF1684 domain-containing protein [Candidatus Kapabacteria bacterium]
MKQSFIFNILLLSILVLMVSCSSEEELSDKLPNAEDPNFNASEILKYREYKNTNFKTSDQSPIPEAKRATFQGLKYYNPTEDFSVPATFVASKTKETSSVGTTKFGETRTYIKAGILSFVVNEKSYSLTAFYYSNDENKELLFVPFKDATSGKLTYDVGRYLDIPVVPNGDYIIDFNLAYNPYCAYNDNYSCPLVPKENVLPIEINAGEKKPDF